VHGLDILLFHGLDRYEPHVGSAHRFTDGLGVVGVVLVALYLRFDELGGDQLDGIPSRLKLACPVMGAAAGFHPDLAPWLDRIEPYLELFGAV
jgi:hypothetical protein